MKKFDLYVTLSTFGEVNPEPLRVLEKSALCFGINKSGKRPTSDEVLRNFGGAVVLVAGVEDYDAPTLARFYQQGLRCISRCGVGTENIDRQAADQLGIQILNTPQEPVQAVAEHTLCLILALLRKLPDLDRDTKAGKWKRHTGNLLEGKTVGLVGFGKIGKKTAELLKPFGVRILVWDPFAAPELGVERAESFEQVLRQADIVSLHCPPTAEKVGSKEFSLMKPGSWLINTARGDLVDDYALAKVLESEHLAGAALDVFPQEPYAGILLSTKKIILTPHQATLTEETRLAMEIAATQNAIKFINQNNPNNQNITKS